MPICNLNSVDALAGPMLPAQDIVYRPPWIRLAFEKKPLSSRSLGLRAVLLSEHAIHRCRFFLELAFDVCGGTVDY